MERVAFLIEETGERISCLLNPSSVVRRRIAGVRWRRSLTVATGDVATDDQLLTTGGGMTDLQLDLLFDLSMAGSSIASDDVRDLTQPFWDLAENRTSESGALRPPLVRFIWGKSWNVQGVVTSIAERLESFTADGQPRRSWLRLKLVRTHADPSERRIALLPLPETTVDPELQNRAETYVHDVKGGGEDEPGWPDSERLDQIAWLYYGDASAWRSIATLNDLELPFKLPAATRLRIP